MLFVEPSFFNYCQGLTIELVSTGSAGGFGSTRVVVDSLRYTVREGEVLPEYP